MKKYLFSPFTLVGLFCLFLAASCTQSTEFVPKNIEEAKQWEEYKAKRLAADSAITKKVYAEMERLQKELTFFGPIIAVKPSSEKTHWRTDIVSTSFKGQPITAEFTYEQIEAGLYEFLDSTIFAPKLRIINNVVVNDGWTAEILYKN